MERNLLHINKTYSRINKKDLIDTPKTENSVRTINIPNFLKEEVKEYAAKHYEFPEDRRLFPIVARTLQKRLKKYEKSAGVKPIRVHDLRHSHVAYLEEHNANMQEVNEKWLDQLENIEREISSAYENREEADKQADQAKKKAAQYEKKLTEIAPMVKDMERFAEKYSADPDEVLPEAGTLETGKDYREKKAKPLIKKIVTVLQSVYRAYLDLSRRFTDMRRSYERAWSKANSLTTRVEELWNENRMLRESLGDFERVKGALGRDTVETIVQAEKQREQRLKEQKCVRRRKMDRGIR